MAEKALIEKQIHGLREQVAAWKQAGLRIGLVPTMGAIHAGHLALVERARAHGGKVGGKVGNKVVASVFVNPKQFGPNEDFAAYPRQLDTDARLLSEAGCDLIYAPQTNSIYPPGFATTVAVSGLTDVLCGASRPGHFAGVTTIVAKLFNQCQPDFAVFGEKDYQQLLVIRQMVRDLDMPVEILAHPIIREPDGLALSSRNTYLSDEQRQTAPRLYATLEEMAAALRAGQAPQAVFAQARKALQQAGFRIDYLELRDPETLQDRLTDAPRLQQPARIFAAAFLGATRLIDNLAVSPASPS